MEETYNHSDRETAKELLAYAISRNTMAQAIETFIDRVRACYIHPDELAHLAERIFHSYRAEHATKDYELSESEMACFSEKLLAYLREQLEWSKEIPAEPGLYAAAYPDEDGWEVSYVSIEGLPGDNVRYTLLDGGVAYPANPNSTLHDAYWHKIILPEFPSPLS